MGPEQFRKLALGLPGAEEREHMDHPDFRVNGKIFATLGYPDEAWAMVKLTRDQQSALVRKKPQVFMAVGGTWGKRGATHVKLGKANTDEVREVLALAWGNMVGRVSRQHAPRKRSQVADRIR